MSSNRHNIIGKQEIQFTFNGTTDALQLNKHIDTWYRDELYPAVQTTLDKYGKGIDTLRLDQLVIDVDIESGDQWQRVMTDKIIRQLNEQLSAKINTTPADVSAELVKSSSFEDVLLFYIENGYLPWFSSVKTKTEFLREYKKWLLQADYDYANKIRLIKAMENSIVLERFYTITPQGQFFRFFALLIDNKKTDINNIEYDVHVLLSKLPSAYCNKLISLFFRAVLLEIIKSKSFTTLSVFKGPLKKMLKQLVLQKKVSITFLSIQKAHSEIMADLLEEIPVLFIKSKLKLPNWKSEYKSAKSSDSSDKETVENEHKALHVIFINNAGLVILSPFLPVLFERLGISKSNVITDKALALHVLFYLTTGKQHPAEFELILPKILCGLALNESVNLNKKLTVDQKKEADNLLAAVIDHWSVLKNTSVEALRSSFLQRDGKLSFSDNGWQLQVEQKSYDMLLEQLPWNISMIQHSWMTNLLRTDWM